MKKILAILLLLLPILAHSQFSDEALKQLEDSILKIMDKNNIPGTQFAITSRDSTLCLGNLGFADVKNGVPVTDQTLFRIGSVTKSFTAVATMMLVEQGRLNLNDELKIVAPEVEFENPWEDTHPVSIANLLEHTTGFDDIHLVEYTTQAEGWSTLEGLEFHPDSRESRWKPGMHSSYCNSGPACVGYVIEKLSGIEYESFVQKNIFDPIGMQHSNYFYTDYTKNHLSVAYMDAELNEADYWHILDRASGAINSTAEEMAKYIRLYLNKGLLDTIRIISEASIQRIEHPQSTLAAKAGITEGYGLNIENRTYRGLKVCGHNGGMDGFLCAMSYFPELGIGYIFIINNSGVDGFSDINRLLMDFVVPDSLKINAVDIADTTLAVNSSMIGWYRSANSRAQIAAFAQRIGDVVRIIENDGKYYSKALFDPPKRLYPLQENVLIRDSNSGKFTPYVFVSDDEGNDYIQIPGYGANYIKTTGFSIWLNLGILALCLAMALSSVLAALIWGPISLFSKRKYRFLAGRSVPFIAVVFMILFMLSFSLGMNGDMMKNFGTLTIYSFSYFLFTILFALTSVIAFVVSIISFKKKMNKLARIHSFLLSCCLLIVTVYLLYYDMIGLRFWAY